MAILIGRDIKLSPEGIGSGEPTPLFSPVDRILAPTGGTGERGVFRPDTDPNAQLFNDIGQSQPNLSASPQNSSAPFSLQPSQIERLRRLPTRDARMQALEPLTRGRAIDTPKLLDDLNLFSADDRSSEVFDLIDRLRSRGGIPRPSGTAIGKRVLSNLESPESMPGFRLGQNLLTERRMAGREDLNEPLERSGLAGSPSGVGLRSLERLNRQGDIDIGNLSLSAGEQAQDDAFQLLGADESAISRDILSSLNIGERGAGRDFLTRERLGTQDFTSSENALNREVQREGISAAERLAKARDAANQILALSQAGGGLLAAALPSILAKLGLSGPSGLAQLLKLIQSGQAQPAQQTGVSGSTAGNIAGGIGIAGALTKIIKDIFGGNGTIPDLNFGDGGLIGGEITGADLGTFGPQFGSTLDFGLGGSDIFSGGLDFGDDFSSGILGFDSEIPDFDFDSGGLFDFSDASPDLAATGEATGAATGGTGGEFSGSAGGFFDEGLFEGGGDFLSNFSAGDLVQPALSLGAGAAIGQLPKLGPAKLAASSIGGKVIGGIGAGALGFGQAATAPISFLSALGPALGVAGVFAAPIMDAIIGSPNERKLLAEGFAKNFGPVFQSVGLQVPSIGQVGGGGATMGELKPLPENLKPLEGSFTTLEMFMEGMQTNEGIVKNGGGLLRWMLQNSLVDQNASPEQVGAIMRGIMQSPEKAVDNLMRGLGSSPFGTRFLGNIPDPDNPEAPTVRQFEDTSTATIDKLASRFETGLSGIESAFGQPIPDKQALIEQGRKSLIATGFKNRVDREKSAIIDRFEDEESKLQSDEKALLEKFGNISNEEDLTLFKAMAARLRERQQDDS